MKKLLLILMLIVLTNFVNGQKKDTVAKQPVLYIIGSLPDFQLLYKAIEKPEEITRGQVAALLNWISKVQVLPEEKKVKPKE